MKRVIPVAAATVMLALAACSSSATSHGSTAPAAAATHAPPSAMSLAQQVAGVTGCSNATPDATSTGDVICELPDGSALELATFASVANEQQWIEDGGTGLPPDPSYAGCCIQGSGWAATVGTPDYVDRGSVAVIAALGGRVVNG